MNSDYLNNYSIFNADRPKLYLQSRQYKSLVVETPNRHRQKLPSNRPYTTGIPKTSKYSRIQQTSLSHRSFNTLQSIDHHFNQTFKGNGNNYFKSRFASFINKKKQRGLKELIRKYANNPQDNAFCATFNCSFKSLDIIDDQDNLNKKQQTNLIQSFPILTNATEKIYRLLQLKNQKQESFEQIKETIKTKKDMKANFFKRILQTKPVKDEQWSIEWLNENIKQKKRYIMRLAQHKKQKDSSKQKMIQMRL